MVSLLADDQGTIYIQLRTEDGENFFITPIKVLREMIEDAEKLLVQGQSSENEQQN